MWAPITGPISETKTGSEPKTSRQRSTSCWAFSGSWMCWTTQASAPSSWRSLRVVDEPLEHAPAGAHPLDRGDLLLEGQDRLDLQRRADPAPGRRRSGRRGAGTRACRSRTTSCSVLAGLVGPLDDRLAAAAGRRPRARGRERRAGPCPPQADAAVDDVDPLAALALVDQPLARLVGRLEGPRDPGGEVDRDDLAALREQRLVDLDEVADRGL